jgi:hypothetical protein
MAAVPTGPTCHVCRGRVASLQRKADHAECLLANGSKLRVSRFLAAHVSSGDEIAFPLFSSSVNRGTELYVVKASGPGHSRDLYQAPIDYVTQPQKNKRNQLFVSAEVREGSLGIASIFFRCEVLRDYFYRIPRGGSASDQHTLYDVLRVPAAASPTELRVAYKLRALEFDSAGAPHNERVDLERAFNILAQPELRACYDALLTDSEGPAPFPYSGFGSLLVGGERSRDDQAFFANRILAFLPDRRQRQFHAPLRKCDFYDDRALYRDARRNLEFWIDHAALHMVWDSRWNQWKHLLGAKMQVNATFVQSGRYQHRHGKWELALHETALPSRLEVKVPANIHEQVEAARKTYHRFGQYSAALAQIRLRVESQAVEKSELEKMCLALRVPADFDVTQISWQPDYDLFFYRELAGRARRIYLFRSEYVFDLEETVAVETPQLGHATYLFAKPKNMEGFLAVYTKVPKDDIRHNRGNVAEKLGFLGRVTHGANPRVWLKELRRRSGESPVV